MGGRSALSEPLGAPRVWVHVDIHLPKSPQAVNQRNGCLYCKPMYVAHLCIFSDSSPIKPLISQSKSRQTTDTNDKPLTQTTRQPRGVITRRHTSITFHVFLCSRAPLRSHPSADLIVPRHNPPDFRRLFSRAKMTA